MNSGLLRLKARKCTNLIRMTDYYVALALWILTRVQPVVLESGDSVPAFPESWKKLEPSVPSKSGFRCFALCLAKCVVEEAKTDEARRNSALGSTCNHKCQQYNKENLCPSSDVLCWTRCRDLIQASKADGLPQAVPENVTVTYTRFPQPTPHEADLTWRRVPEAILYAIKYMELSETESKDQKEPILRVVSGTQFHFVKPVLCSMYAFAVAAVFPNGLGHFSESLVLEEPKPVILSPSYDFISAERINEPFAASPDDPDGIEYNSTVVVLIGFTPPPNWNLSTEITRIEANVHVVNSGSTRLSFSTQPKWVPNLAHFEIRLPGPVADSFAYYKFMFTVEKIFTKCDDQNAFYYPSYVYNPSLNQTMPGLAVQINCHEVKNSGCTYNPAALMPQCAYKDVRTDVKHDEGSDVADVAISFTSRHDPYGDRPVLWYNVTFGEGQKGGSIPELLFNMTTLISTRKLENTTHNFTLANLEVGNVYVLYICSIYDLRTPNIVGNLNDINRFTIDLTAYDRKPAKSGRSDVHVTTVVIAPILAALFLGTVVLTLFITRRRRRNKVMDEFGVEYNDDEDGRYVTLKRRYDHWEIPRRRLQIDQNHKLGSGAFGAVYKGRIIGTLTKDRDSKSVLAEYWMQAENCEVAVKMLPAYADEVSKSEFQSEINLMKQLGYHERLVNMLACITATDPLCLIVEYCSESDLLNYLRKRRKYMIMLEEKGIDINNSSDSSDLDLNMVLCKKDLISFAWQISVGMEYLSERGYIHRDVAARNILVASGKRAKIGDFGLCRYSCSDPVYMSKGGRLPIKWMALEAIKSYEFTTKSDVWSYGVLLFEIVTLGGSPYPGVQPHEMEAFLESGQRMEQPESCPYELYEVMLDCWRADPDKRPTFTCLREGMRLMLEHITEDYYYMGLNQARDYYNVAYQQDDFADPQSSETQLPEGACSSDDHHPENSVPSSPTDTISIEESGDNTSTLENNVFEAPPTPPAKTEASVEPSTSGPTDQAVKAPPLPPRLKPRRLTSVGGESVSSLDESVCASPAFMAVAVRRLDSTSSDQALLSPSPSFFGDKPPKFFKFTPSTKLSPLPELTPIPTVTGAVENQERSSVLDQRVEREPVTPRSTSPATPLSPNNYFQSLLPVKK